MVLETILMIFQFLFCLSGFLSAQRFNMDDPWLLHKWHSHLLLQLLIISDELPLKKLHTQRKIQESGSWPSPYNFCGKFVQLASLKSLSDVQFTEENKLPYVLYIWLEKKTVCFLIFGSLTWHSYATISSCFWFSFSQSILDIELLSHSSFNSWCVGAYTAFLVINMADLVLVWMRNP